MTNEEEKKVEVRKGVSPIGFLFIFLGIIAGVFIFGIIAKIILYRVSKNVRVRVKL